MKAGDAVRGVIIRTDLDSYLDLRALSGYTSLSRRTLQALVNDAHDPLPSYRVGGKVLVRRSECDAWLARRRNRKPLALARLAAADAEALLKVRPRSSPPLDKPTRPAYDQDASARDGLAKRTEKEGA